MKEKSYESGVLRPGARRFDTIEDEITADIDFILRNRLKPLYRTERYKYKKHSIEILCPKTEYPKSQVLLKNADHVRFILSLYPDKKDLLAVDRIIMRPRHIEAGRVELMALYLRKKKTLIHYLYMPHTYDVTKSSVAAYNEYLPFEIPKMVNRQFYGAGRDSDMMIPSLLYILSMLGTTGNEIDKFFVKSQDSDNDNVFAELDEISEYYRQHGY